MIDEGVSMEYRMLGDSGLKVSRLCFGGLTVGPLQRNMSAGQGGRLIMRAMEMGVNFIDTAELYETYPHIAYALKHSSRELIISSKCYAYSREQAVASVEKCRRELDRDVIDIFMMHEQVSRMTLKGHREALEYYLEEKAKGRIRAVGVSTHNIEVVEACAEMPEIDVIHPLINKTGIGINDGTAEEMLTAIHKARSAGKGIYAMKALGGGNLLASYEECLNFALDNDDLDSIAVGMQSEDEIMANVMMFDRRCVEPDVKQRLDATPRRLHIDFWCEGCGKCAKRCKMNAIRIVDGKAVVDEAKCVTCGYCGSVCPEFAIKIM